MENNYNIKNFLSKNDARNLYLEYLINKHKDTLEEIFEDIKNKISECYSYTIYGFKNYLYLREVKEILKNFEYKTEMIKTEMIDNDESDYICYLKISWYC